MFADDYGQKSNGGDETKTCQGRTETASTSINVPISEDAL
jgi:hypothetical protein